MHVAVIGGGLIGLSTAWALSRCGVSVTVFESGRMGRGASWAAGGMLAAHVEDEACDPAFLTLARASQDLWPGFAAALTEATGLPLEVDQAGTLVAAFDPVTADRWRDLCRSDRLRSDLHWLSPREARGREPGLARDCLGAAFSPRDHQIDPRAAVSALIKACQASGVTLAEDRPVLAIDARGGRVTGVITPEGRIGCDAAVLAAGAWSGRIEGQGPGAAMPVRPIKGQMACLVWDQPAPPPRHVIWGPGLYAIPRADGRLVLGASVEDVGFDPRLTAGAVGRLLQAVARTLPGAEACALQEMWAGYRPAAPDRRPVIGPGALDGLTIATGHHRNGILLAPVTAEIVRDLVLGAVPRHNLTAFSPARFWTAGPRPRVTAPSGARTETGVRMA